MATKDNKFITVFNNFNTGQAPLAHLDSLSTVGNSGQYTVATNVDIISKPGILSQGPGLATLTAGTETGAVTDQINFIIDKAVASSQTYGVSDTLLHRITPTAVTNTGIFPHTITDATAGNSAIHFQGDLFYFFNKASGGDIGKYDLSSTFDDNWGSTVPTGASALQKAPHPVAKKEDIMLFGNGRYVGTYISSTTTLAPTKLDFGEDTEVADVCFQANQWWLAVNSGITTGTNRASAQIYLYDGSAVSTLLSDEVALGVQQIGFILPVNGVIYVAYKDLSSTGGFAIGYVSGRQIKPLRYFTGSLPTFAQKTLYKNTIAFVSGGLIYSVGAVVEQLPLQISQLADGGFATVGALASPFGTPMIASNLTTSFKLAKFSGLDVNCTFKGLVIPTISSDVVGMIDKIVVMTNVLKADASCLLKIESNQGVTSTTIGTITTTGKTRHSFSVPVNNIEDYRFFLDWSGGNATNGVEIKSVYVKGHFKEIK